MDKLGINIWLWHQCEVNRSVTEIGFKPKNEDEGQSQSSPKLIWMFTVLRYIWDPHLEILTWIGGDYHVDKLKMG